jgi:aryl carrier-like protein
VLIDLQSVKSTANQDDRSRSVLLQLGIDSLSVVSLFVKLVTQPYAVTFNKQGPFRQRWTSKREMAFSSRGRLVFGRPASEGLQKVTAVPNFVWVEQLSAHIAQFGHILKAERGKDKLVPAASDGVVHLNIQPRQGSILSNFLATREEGRILLKGTVARDF